MSKLGNKVAIITGGSSGIGLATAQYFSPPMTRASLPEPTSSLTAE